MPAAAAPQLAPWANFFVIVGSSAGALTGLQFVVMALIAQARVAGTIREVRAFGTPTVVHFCAALFVSATLSAPWRELVYVAICLVAFGALGVAYVLNVIRHARRQTGYSPDLEDWVWYTALPLAAYITLAMGGIFLSWRLSPSLFVISAATLVLMAIGIHNAWDTITYVALQRRRKSREEL